jgi:hypothetical protein
VCGAQEGICRVNAFFFNPVACWFLYKAKDLSGPLPRIAAEFLDEIRIPITDITFNCMSKTFSFLI